MASLRLILLLALLPTLTVGCDSGPDDDIDLNLPGLRQFFGCEQLGPITLGSEINGTLEDGDCLSWDGVYADHFAFAVTSPRSIQIDLESSDFDAFLWLFRNQGGIVATDDDSGEGSNARISRVVDAGIYVILASSSAEEETGAYTLRLGTN